MTVRIEIPGAEGDELAAGVLFTNGIATVPQLGANARKYFASIGASITDDASDPLETLAIGDKRLIDCTVPELRELAQTEGIDVPAKASKRDILRLFLDAFTQED